MKARPHGFTLVETACACAVAAVLAGVALPTLQAQRLKARRADAVAALTRLQAAEERLRATQGLYSGDFAVLKVPATTEQALYALAVQPTGAESYRAIATALGDQAADTDCPQLVLEVNSGFATYGPAARCWLR